MRALVILLLLALGCSNSPTLPSDKDPSILTGSNKTTTEKNSEHDVSNWSRYAPAEGDFEVSFPTTPELKMMTLDGQPVHVAAVRRTKVEDLSFTCHWFVNEKPHEHDAGEIIYLRGYQYGAVTAAKGKLIEEKEIDLEGYRGRDFTIAFTDTDVGRTRVYVAGRRVISLGVAGRNKEATSTGDALKFLDSLKIISEKR